MTYTTVRGNVNPLVWIFPKVLNQFIPSNCLCPAAPASTRVRKLRLWPIKIRIAAPRALQLVKFSPSGNPSFGYIMKESKLEIFFFIVREKNEHSLEQFFLIKCFYLIFHA